MTNCINGQNLSVNVSTVHIGAVTSNDSGENKKFLLVMHELHVDVLAYLPSIGGI